MDPLLVVKFPWSRRSSRNKPDPKLDNVNPSPSSSRTTTYVKKLKETDTQRYVEYKEKEKTRKRKAYVKVEERPKSNLMEQRQRWTATKRKQRQTKRDNSNSSLRQEDGGLPPQKRFKDLNESEKKEYYRQKMATSRASRSRQKEHADKQTDRQRKRKNPEDDESAERRHTSRTLRYKKRKDLQESMPQTPKSFADCYVGLLNNATVSQKKEVVEKGMLVQGARNLRDSLDAVDSIKKEVKNMGRNPTNDNRKFLRKLAQVTGKTKGKLGISWRFKSKLSKMDVKRKQRRGKAISERIYRLIQEFWLSDVSRELPLKRYIKKRVPLHLLETSYLQAYKMFRCKYPDVSVGFVTFIKNKPGNVRRMKALERSVCCCIKCENIKHLARAVNAHLIKCNQKELQITAETKHVSDFTLCSNELQSIACISRKCENCGPSSISDYLKSVLSSNGNDLVKFSIWETVKKTKLKKDKLVTYTRTELVEKESAFNKLISLLLEKVNPIPSHIFRARWQQDYLKNVKENMPPNSVILIMDYAENYVCEAQDEVQSAHWSNDSATIHPIMAFINDTDSRGPFIKTESIIFISNDSRHDADGVAHFMKILHPYLKQQYPTISHIEQFSDGCASQYRCAKSFNDLANHACAHDITINHNYFESSHGKSSADGLGAIVKYNATLAVTRRQAIIKDAKGLFSFCEKNLHTPGHNSVYKSASDKYANSHRKFFYVDEHEVRRNRPKLKTIPGTMSIHCVSVSKDHVVCHRNLSCNCDGCKDISKKCSNADIIEPWKPMKTIPANHGFYCTRHELTLDQTCSDTERNGAETCPGSPTVDDLQSHGLCVAPGSPTVDDIIQSSVQLSMETKEQHQRATSCELEQFSAAIAAKGWTIHGHTENDGNCFFRVVADQLTNRLTHAELRCKVISHMEALPEAEKTKLGNFIDGNNYKEYIRKMTTNGTYADHIVIKMMADVLACNIRIVVAGGDDIVIGNFEREIIVGYLQQIEHYVSLQPSRPAPLRPEILSYVCICLEMSRRKEHYVAQVMKRDDEQCQVEVKYMVPLIKHAKESTWYIWPVVEETSWADFKEVKAILPDPDLDINKSTNRRTVFKFPDTIHKLMK